MNDGGAIIAGNTCRRGIACYRRTLEPGGADRERTRCRLISSGGGGSIRSGGGQQNAMVSAYELLQSTWLSFCWGWLFSGIRSNDAEWLLRVVALRLLALAWKAFISRNIENW